MDFSHALANWLVQNAGLQANVSLFLGRKAQLPVKGTVSRKQGFIVIVETGGPDALRSQRTGIQRPTVQLASVADTPLVARALMQTVYDALGGVNGLTNITLSGLFCQRVVARGIPRNVSTDDVDDVMFTLNVDGMTQASSTTPPSGGWVQGDWL